jgi:leucyl aminopeptidase (aminopeptidase T)
VSGVYVADASVGGGVGARAGLLAPRPIRLTIENGRVIAVDCSDATLREHVRVHLTRGQNLDRVGLVTIGTNLGIRSAIGEIVHDENLPGLHIALGTTIPTRSGATWTARGQLAFAAASSDVDVDGEPLIRHGRYVRFV